jgi:hypothetical protein
LEAKARQSAMVCSKPVYVFQQLMHYLQEQRIFAPGYSFMQDTVGQALTSEQARLTTIVCHHLQNPDREALNLLLSDSQGLYEITLLKREPKDFSLGEIKGEIHRGEQIHNLYRLAEKLLPHLLISNESIKHYASLVTYYSVFRLKRFDLFLVYLYLICFVYHRYQRLHDNLIYGRISSGENKHLKIKRRGQHVHWTLQYPRSSESVNHPLFDALKQVDISDVMHFVNQKCQFMEAFEHILGRYIKQERDDHALIAALVAWATNTGLSRMAEISDLEYHILAATSDNVIRLETLSEANDCICNAIAVSRRRPLLFA